MITKEQVADIKVGDLLEVITQQLRTDGLMHITVHEAIVTEVSAYMVSYVTTKVVKETNALRSHKVGEKGGFSHASHFDITLLDSDDDDTCHMCGETDSHANGCIASHEGDK